MANLEVEVFYAPFVVGGLSAAANIVSENHKATKLPANQQFLIKNAGMMVDVGLPVLGIVNHLSGAVIKGPASRDFLVASATLGFKTGAEFLGRQVLKLNVAYSKTGVAPARGTRTPSSRDYAPYDRAPGRSEYTPTSNDTLPIIASVT